MARVNLEPKLFGSGRLGRLQELMAWDKATTLGTLALLWHDSQAEERLSGTPDEIAEWAWVRADIPKLIAALVTCRFLRPQDDGTYHICGNGDQLEWLATRRWAGAKGGRAKAINELRKHELAHAKHLPSNPVAKPAQSKAKQSKAERPALSAGEPPTPTLSLAFDPPPKEPKGADVWAAYRAAYFAAYRVEPKRNAKVNNQCKNLVDRLGGDGAIGVVKFFLTLRDGFYVSKCHQLGQCLSDAEALHTQMLGGQRISASKPRALRGFERDTNMDDELAEIENRVRQKFKGEQNGE